VGLVLMSERELNRIEVLGQVADRRMTAITAANVLGLSRRQVHRLLKTYQAYGAAAIRHKARGRRSNNRIDPGVWDFAVMLVKENYADVGPTLAAEMLTEHHDLKVSRETLRKCPLGRLLRNRLPGNRCRTLGFGFHANSGARFINRVCVGNVLAN
jgi:hypothetical protein